MLKSVAFLFNVKNWSINGVCCFKIDLSYINFLKHFLNLFFLQKVQKTCQETNKKVQFTTKKRGQETNKKKNQWTNKKRSHWTQEKESMNQ